VVPTNAGEFTHLTLGVDGDCCETMGCDWAADHNSDTVAQKTEPKVFFANERTFIAWLGMAVNLSSISIGVIAFTKHSSRGWMFGMSLLPLALLFIGYALWTYLWRAEKIRTRDTNRWDDPVGPMLLGLVLIIALSSQFYLKLADVLYPIVPVGAAATPATAPKAAAHGY
jgi:uncharacterized membrane protein YidH (DUF202 family)